MFPEEPFSLRLGRKRRLRIELGERPGTSRHHSQTQSQRWGVIPVRIADSTKLVPQENAAEAAVVEQIDAIPISSLAEAAGFLSGSLERKLTPLGVEELFTAYSGYDIDYADVRGQAMAKRAVTLAAAGNHSLLMV